MQYEERTKELRGAASPESPLPLLVSIVKPHKPVSPAIVGRWIKDTLALAGIDTGIFKAHSTRSASTSSAKAQGVSVADITTMAGWLRESTFQRFYHKPVEGHNSSFSQVVLGDQKGNSL